MTVKTFAIQESLWEKIVLAINSLSPQHGSAGLLERVAEIPVRRSRATRSLGAYVSKQGAPLCIRLQFAQEAELLHSTFLHEVAHACDHLQHQPGRKYRRAHSETWKRWAAALGVPPVTSARSDAVSRLHSERLKLVATCQKCDEKFYRLRRLNRAREYRHRACGGRLLPV